MNLPGLAYEMPRDSTSVPIPLGPSDIVALQRCDHFVGRTMNWLYDHLRFVPRYRFIVLCDSLHNRDEFPELDTWCLSPASLPRRICRRLTQTLLYPTERWRIRRLLPRVLHSHFGYVAIRDLALQRVLDVPWVVGFYGADVYQLERLPDSRHRYGLLFERATRLLPTGPMMAARLKQLGCPGEKILIHPLGVDVHGLPSKPRVIGSGEPLKILFAGTFREKKGLCYAIEAAGIARRTGVRLELHLVGDERGKSGDREIKQAAFRRIRALDLQDAVTHYPFMRFQELVALALRCHVFLAPSVTAEDGDAEGAPFVLQQMLATAMPAIATAHSDIPYVYGEHAHWLVPERDAHAIAERLQRYADDPDTLPADGLLLQDRIRRAFDVRTCAARLSNLYDSIR